MNTKNRLGAWVLSGAMAVGLAAPFALAQTATDKAVQEGQQKQGGGRHRWGRHGRGKGRHAFGGVALTDGQKTQMKQLRESFQQRTESLRTELRNKTKELHQANQGGAFNESLVAQKLAETAPLRAKLMGERLKLRQEMMAVLTPEQKTQLEQRREQFKQKMQQRREHKTEQQSSVVR